MFPARCSTISGRNAAIAAATRPASATSPANTRIRPLAEVAEVAEVAEEASATRSPRLYPATSAPSALSQRTAQLPRNPVWPVTRTRRSA